MEPKALRKLVKVCRELGVLHYKGVDFEFTLSPEAPMKVKKNDKSFTSTDDGKDFQSDSLTPEELMFWSAAPDGTQLEKESG